MFTGDTIFSECQTWLMGSDITVARRARRDRQPRRRLGSSPATASGDHAGVPRHPARRTCSTGCSAVADAVAKGWSREETSSGSASRDRYPVDIGQGYMMNHIQTLNAGSLWDKLTQARPA